MHRVFTSLIQEQLDLTIHQVGTTIERELHGRKNHPFWSVSHLYSGTVILKTGGETYRVEAGDVMVHPPNVPFTEDSIGVCTTQWIKMDAKTSSRIDLLRIYPLPAVVALTDPASYASKFSELLDIYSDFQSPLREINTFACFIQILSLLLKSWHDGGALPRSAGMLTEEDRLVKVIFYMSKRLHRKITREELADVVHLSPSYLDRVFLESYGIRPLQMLRDLRLKHARHLLETTGQTLEAIAAASGLQDASYLTKVFSQRFGITPGRYRRNLKEKAHP
jgi:AraC-like DNA-binding protein/mannose-6-phosphate isomerase-like protein (cupin superfamily)